MRFALLVLPIALAACAGTETAPPVEPSPLEQAAEAFPGVDVQGIANCVRANATEDELVLLAQGGDLAQTTTRQIMQKPETGQCLVDSGIQLPRASGS